MAGKKIMSSKKVSAPAVSTPVRNTSLPPRQSTMASSPQKKSPPTYEQIAKRAYEIWKSGKGGSQDDNWFRAERELKGI
ncbi:MAG TPA: DUF2934 domain-containing protein [Tepidisphaeraceae bacterium]|nr:DUF2934 domain-containing protein [Tepidisphaeraceae bacterium]